jgi:hypothetical protein
MYVSWLTVISMTFPLDSDSFTYFLPNEGMIVLLPGNLPKNALVKGDFDFYYDCTSGDNEMYREILAVETKSDRAMREGMSLCQVCFKKCLVEKTFIWYFERLVQGAPTFV